MNAKTGEHVQMWLAKAGNDLINAEIILASKARLLPFDTVCFHCQQATEKFLKAFLVMHEKPFPYTHNLADLVAVCIQVDPSFAEIQRKAEMLTPFAVEIRYPDDYYMPSSREAEEAYNIAVEIKAFILTRLGDMPHEDQDHQG